MITSIVPNIVTERAVVRLATRKDSDAVLNYYLENRDRLSPFSPTWPEGFFTKSFWDKQIDRNVEEFYSDVSVRMFAFEKDTRTPRCLSNISLGGILRNAAQFCYLGYGVAREWEGKGLMLETVGAVVGYGFDQLHLHRIMANYVPTNERSGRLLRRLGFSIDGYARDYLYLDGEWKDHIITSITNPNWKPPV